MDLTQRAAHFDFGKNWASYSDLIGERQLESAVDNVRSLVGDLKGKSFLDIGCGSGLFSLAALRLGAEKVLAVDIDESSVATTRKVLEASGCNGWDVQEASVFDLKAGSFDVVYSWGVLHHTGSMWKAIDAAAAHVKPQGLFMFALYEKSPLCGLWTVEKRYYMRAPRIVQKAMRGLYVGTFALGLLATGRNPARYMREQRDRGMEFHHNVHDWMGGYPYESTDAPSVDRFMRERGFEAVDVRPTRIWALGLWGSGCSEYVYRRL